MSPRTRRAQSLALAAFLAAGLLGTSCRSRPVESAPVVEITRVPESAEGGSGRLEPIEGRVTGARPGQQIVLFAKSGFWWVQPFTERPFTPIRPDATWQGTTHLGSEYAALLVEATYRPPPQTDVLPEPGQGVVAVARRSGSLPARPSTAKTLRFAGHDWTVRSTPSERGGWPHRYDPGNAWTDEAGALHLRLARDAEGWTCAEVILTRSLGHGTYTFVVRDISGLPPAVVLGLFTWDDGASEQRFREMDVEISRWGDPSSANAQYVVQPYYVPANVRRFSAPKGVLTHTLRWEAGRAAFRTVRGEGGRPGRDLVAEHTFTSGVPSPGREVVRMNLYLFGAPPASLPEPIEVVIDTFEYLP